MFLCNRGQHRDSNRTRPDMLKRAPYNGFKTGLIRWNKGHSIEILHTCFVNQVNIRDNPIKYQDCLVAHFKVCYTLSRLFGLAS